MLAIILASFGLIERAIFVIGIPSTMQSSLSTGNFTSMLWMMIVPGSAFSTSASQVSLFITT